MQEVIESVAQRLDLNPELVRRVMAAAFEELTSRTRKTASQSLPSGHPEDTHPGSESVGATIQPQPTAAPPRPKRFCICEHCGSTVTRKKFVRHLIRSHGFSVQEAEQTQPRWLLGGPTKSRRCRICRFYVPKFMMAQHRAVDPPCSERKDQPRPKVRARTPRGSSTRIGRDSALFIKVPKAERAPCDNCGSPAAAGHNRCTACS